MRLSLPPELRRQLSSMTAAELLAALTGQSFEVHNPDETLRRKQAAEYLAISQSWLRELERKGEGPPAIRISDRIVRYRVGDLDQWRDAHKKRGKVNVGTPKAG